TGPTAGGPREPNPADGTTLLTARDLEFTQEYMAKHPGDVPTKQDLMDAGMGSGRALRIRRFIEQEVQSGTGTATRTGTTQKPGPAAGPGTGSPSRSGTADATPTTPGTGTDPGPAPEHGPGTDAGPSDAGTGTSDTDTAQPDPAGTGPELVGAGTGHAANE
ncbi:hypothetical protein HDA43_006944, partial [Streptosporangium sandarakinum]|nr:hypothetical protein [Streptosporangium sandarakinum]